MKLYYVRYTCSHPYHRKIIINIPIFTSEGNQDSDILHDQSHIASKCEAWIWISIGASLLSIPFQSCFREQEFTFEPLAGWTQHRVICQIWALWWKLGWPNHNFILWDCMTMEKGSFPFPEQSWVAYLWRGKVVHWVRNSDVLRIRGPRVTFAGEAEGDLLQWMEHTKVTTAAGNGYLIGRVFLALQAVVKKKRKPSRTVAIKLRGNHGIATVRAAGYWVFAVLYMYYFI